MPNEELVNKSILPILKKRGNDICADCESIEIYYACVTQGLFLCKKCGELHRLLDNSNIVSIYTNNFNEDDIQSLDYGGNSVSKRTLEATLPCFYRRPCDLTAECIRAEFITGKYVRREFCKDNEALQKRYTTHFKEGLLFKKLRDDNKFVQRYFQLSVNENYLRYFIKQDCKGEPKGSLNLERLNATFIDDKAFKVPMNTLLLTYIKEGATRNLFVYSDDRKLIVDWYNALRCGKMHRLYMSLAGMGTDPCNESVTSVAESLTYDVSHCGWLEKTGPRSKDSWRKRWCILIRRALRYYPDPTAPFAKGEIFIGSYENGFDIKLGAPDNWRKHSGHAFTIVTPSRLYVFVSDDQANRDRWVEALTQQVKIPMTLQEDKEAAGLYRKRSSSFDVLKK